MYLSRVQLDTDKRYTQFALINPNKLHGAIEESFSDRQSRKLWRIDRFNGKTYILFVSEEMPEFSDFIRQFGYDGESAEIKSYDNFLNSIQKGSIWKFRLVANPTKISNGRRMAYKTNNERLEWLNKKSLQNGFRIIKKGDENLAMIRAAEWLNFKKQNKYSIHVLAVSYEGILLVEDPSLLKNALCNGIGREKAYGMGMLTIMKE